jgi:threonine/homoserine/homoserine lactone efflux protein
MDALVTFLLGFFFSFVGSIPPGSLNLSIIQLGLDHRMNIAWRFALAAAVVEYPYAWLAIRFENLITSSDAITGNIQLISSIVLIALGIFNLWSARNIETVYQKFSSSGFRRGILLSILNPLALPFWIGVTAYLKSSKVITLDTNLEVHSYLAGVSLGAFILLILLAYLAKKMVRHFRENTILKNVPGLTLLFLGLYGLAIYFL